MAPRTPSDILVKLTTDEFYFLGFLKQAAWSLVQDSMSKELKAHKREWRQRARGARDTLAAQAQRAVAKALRRATAAREVLAEESSGDETGVE